LLLALLLGACASAPPPPRSVSIQRTQFGVAHIEARDLEMLAHGVAYAHAQDNICQTADQLLTVRGERSRHLGASGTGWLGLRRLPNQQIDMFVASHMDDKALATAWARETSADAQAMARGYVAGYNHYLSDAVATLPAPCARQPWVTPMTLADYYRLTELSMVQAGVAALADAVLAVQPPTGAAVSTGGGDSSDGAPVIASAAALAEQVAIWRQDGEAGSNGWAFGGNVTRDRRGLLLGNPHFPWTGSNRFWQMHLTVPGQLDVMGAAIGHGAVVQIGFNRDVAWTHTVSTGKRFTLHSLTLVDGKPTTYLVDGVAEAMTPREITVQVREADGRLVSRASTVWRSRYGPVVVLPRAGLNWTKSRAWAIQDANTGNVRSTDAWLGFNRAHSVDEIRAGQAKLGIPWVNTIATDRQGNALYADVSVVPDVSADLLRRCAPLPNAAALLANAGLALLDGSRSECNWARDPSSPQPGLTPMNRMPVLLRRDWVQNSNDSFWLANPVQQLAGISPMVGPVGVPQRLRTRAALFEIDERLAGHDGLAADAQIGLPELQAMLGANRSFAAHLVLDDLLDDCTARADKISPSSREACEVLRRWDRSNRVDARGAHLFREWWRIAKDLPGLWRLPFNAEDAVATPGGLKLTDADVSAKVYAALDSAVAIVKSAGYALDAPLGTVQFRKVGDRIVAIPGGDEFEGVLNKVESQGQPKLLAGGYAVNYGTSYVQAVGFDERGPVARGLLTFGQSSQADSPWAYDQLEALQKQPWPVLPFHADDVAKARIGPVLTLSIPAAP
jgi:acyl-homoserine-lactone acylase